MRKKVTEKKEKRSSLTIISEEDQKMPPKNEEVWNEIAIIWSFWRNILRSRPHRQLTSLRSRGHSLTMESFQQEVCTRKIAGRRYYTKNGCWEEVERQRERGGALAELIRLAPPERRSPSYQIVRQLHLTVLKTPVGLAGLDDGLRGLGERRQSRAHSFSPCGH